MLLPIAVLIVQTVPAAAPEAGSALSALARPCAAGPGVDGDVVVCAHPRDADRLTPLRSPVGEAGDRLDPFRLRLPGGASARLRAFQHDLPGATSQGVAVTLSVPMGRK